MNKLKRIRHKIEPRGSPPFLWCPPFFDLHDQAACEWIDCDLLCNVGGAAAWQRQLASQIGFSAGQATLGEFWGKLSQFFYFFPWMALFEVPGVEQTMVSGLAPSLL